MTETYAPGGEPGNPQVAIEGGMGGSYYFMNLFNDYSGGGVGPLSAPWGFYTWDPVNDSSCYIDQGFRVALLAPVPEPSTLLLAAAGLVGLLAYSWRKQK